MFLSVTLFVLLLAGCWLYCLTDAALTPGKDFPWMRKRTWVALIALTFILGAAAWLLVRPTRRRRRLRAAVNRGAAAGKAGGRVTWSPDRPGPGPAGPSRHPAGRARKASRPARVTPAGPDDDPEFLQLLDRLIRDRRDHSE